MLNSCSDCLWLEPWVLTILSLSGWGSSCSIILKGTRSLPMWRRHQAHSEPVVTDVWRCIKSMKGGETCRRSEPSWPPSDLQDRIFFLVEITVMGLFILSYSLWQRCGEYRLDLRWTRIVVDGDVRVMYRWPRERCSMCRWTLYNSEQGPWMIQ